MSKKARKPLTHLDARGQAHMVDVGQKTKSDRLAVARARVHVSKQTAQRLAEGDTPKGDVLATARIAGIQAAKRTSEWIPLCHPIALTHVAVEIEVRGKTIEILATTETYDRTGVEMEAMVAASATALTLYDMLKGIERGIKLEIELLEKRGGRSGTWKSR
jgi:cyclic pyranopterin monophosphate synthase